MTLYRVWRDYKRDTEAEDGREYDTISPEVAAVLFGEEQYSELQHVDPGGVFVRDLETDEVTRWGLRARVTVVAEKGAMPSDFDEEPRAYGATPRQGNDP